MPPSEIFLKTKWCTFFLANKCNKGDTCAFAHSENELRPKYDLCFTKLCVAMQYFGCCYDTACPYAHHVEELRKRNRKSKDKNKKTIISSHLVWSKRETRDAEEFWKRNHKSKDKNAKTIVSLHPLHTEQEVPERQLLGSHYPQPP